MKTISKIDKKVLAVLKTVKNILSSPGYFIRMRSYSSRQFWRKISAKWIPKCLNVYQKRARVEASRSICARCEIDVDFLNRIVIIDETTFLRSRNKAIIC